MIKPEELRMNNLVSVNENYRDQGDLLELNQKSFEMLIMFQTYERIFPIPLSEEWLMKFGFEKHERNPFWFRKGNLMVGLIGVAEMQNELGSTVRISSWINSVHQLQNLVHSLTGEELTLNK